VRVGEKRSRFSKVTLNLYLFSEPIVAPTNRNSDTSNPLIKGLRVLIRARLSSLN
jgi:hypothetical protein